MDEPMTVFAGVAMFSWMVFLLIALLAGPLNLLIGLASLGKVRLGVIALGGVAAGIMATASGPTAAFGFPIGLAVVTFIAAIVAWQYRARDRHETELKLAQLRLKAQALEAHGIAAKGRIVALERTGLTINRNPQIEFTIELENAAGETIHITERALVDLVDIPRVQPGRRVTVRYVPQDPENHEVSFSDDPPEEPVSSSDDNAHSPRGTGAELDRPLWLFGHAGAESWLFPRRRSGPRVVIIDLADPHDGSRDAAGEALVDSAQYLIAEALWARTDVMATAVLLVDVEARRALQPTGQMMTYEQLTPFLGSLDDEPIVVWGAGLSDLQREGVELKVRLPSSSGGSERSL